MSSKTILLTGASGFLGSHLAEELLSVNYRVIAVTRTGTDLWRCKEFENSNLIYVNLDSENFKDLILNHKPDVFIHAAWQGVTGKDRNDENIQSENISFFQKLLTLSKEAGIKRVICFGSQAEYGNYTGKVNEDVSCNPVSEYGKTKLKALKLCSDFCSSNNMDWLWIRLFSVYGTREGYSWLIPSLIKNLVSGKPMNLTGCDQKFDYMYVKDFSKAIVRVLEAPTCSGLYNLGSGSSIQLKVLVEKIKALVNPDAVLNYGAIPYAENQTMHLEGDSSKFYKQFGFMVNSDLDRNIAEVVNYYRNKLKTETILNG